MPFASQQQARFAFGTDQPWAKRWARETDFRKLPKRVRKKMQVAKDAGTMPGAMLSGPGGLLATPGMGGRGRRWGNRRKDKACTCGKAYEPGQLCPYCTADLALPDIGWYRCGNCGKVFYADDTDSDYEDYRAIRAERTAGRGIPAQPATMPVARVLRLPHVATKESLGPGITRIRGNLCNVHGRYGPCDASLSGKRKPKGVKGRKGRKPAKPKLTPEQRAQERAAQQAENRAKVLGELGIAPDGQQALEALRSGQQPDAAALERGGFVKAGLVEQAADGSYRLTASGRAALNAANAGDTGRAGDIISAARDRKASRTAREEAAAQRKRDAEAKRAAAAGKKPKAGAGGGSKEPGSAGEAAEVRRVQREAERQADRKRRETERQEDRAQRQREHAEDRAQRQREREEDRAQRSAERSQMLAERRRRGPARVSATRAPIVSRGIPNRGTTPRRPAPAPAPKPKPAKSGGTITDRQRQTTKSQGVTYKRSRSAAEQRAMFAKMGGGGKGGKGGGGGGNPTLWAKNPKTGKRDQEMGLAHEQDLFGASYVSRQREVQARGAQRDTKQRADDAAREAFFNRQTQGATTNTPPAPKIIKQQPAAATTSAAGGLSKPERYAELESMTQRVKMPQAGWNAPMSGAQKGYLGSLAERARLNTAEGGRTRALADQIIAANKAGRLTKWEASQLIDAMQSPKPFGTLMDAARAGIRSGDGQARWRALLALPSFRSALISATLSDEASAEGLPF